MNRPDSAQPSVSPGKNPAAKRRQDLAVEREKALGCTRCPLASVGTQVVFGEGNPDADLMLVGEAPGAEENATGLPFRGAAGTNLDMFLSEIGRDRSDVYIANIVMCRPPGNRRPRRLEVEECARYLDEQIRLVEPVVIIALGAKPTQRLLGVDAILKRTRGRAHRVGRSVVVSTYHPSPQSLNRVPERRLHVRADFRLALALLAGR